MIWIKDRFIIAWPEGTIIMIMDSRVWIILL